MNIVCTGLFRNGTVTNWKLLKKQKVDMATVAGLVCGIRLPGFLLLP